MRGGSAAYLEVAAGEGALRGKYPSAWIPPRDTGDQAVKGGHAREPAPCAAPAPGQQ